MTPKRNTDKNVANIGQYRKCLNHPVFEMLSMLNGISSTTFILQITNKAKNTEFQVTSVDGEKYKITLFTNKLWDLILLKLTEIVPYGENGLKWCRDYRYDDEESDDDENDIASRKTWRVYLSVKTIADCLGTSTETDALTHLYDRIVAAADVLRNISITVSEGKDCSTIDGYLDFVGVRDCSGTEKTYMTKSNALFCFSINPELIEYMESRTLGLYHFCLDLLHLPANHENAYAAAKRLGRHYSQNSYNRGLDQQAVAMMDIGVLRAYLPRLENKLERDNRIALDKALKSIPCSFYSYILKDEVLTFEEIAKRRLNKAKYDDVKIAIGYYEHPNTSQSVVTPVRITNMNDDYRYIGYPVYPLEIADRIINHSGSLKNVALEDREIMVMEQDITSEFPSDAVPLPDGSIRLRYSKPLKITDSEDFDSEDSD